VFNQTIAPLLQDSVSHNAMKLVMKHTLVSYGTQTQPHNLQTNFLILYNIRQRPSHLIISLITSTPLLVNVTLLRLENSGRTILEDQDGSTMNVDS